MDQVKNPKEVKEKKVFVVVRYTKSDLYDISPEETVTSLRKKVAENNKGVDLSQMNINGENITDEALSALEHGSVVYLSKYKTYYPNQNHLLLESSLNAMVTIFTTTSLRNLDMRKARFHSGKFHYESCRIAKQAIRMEGWTTGKFEAAKLIAKGRGAYSFLHYYATTQIFKNIEKKGEPDPDNIFTWRKANIMSELATASVLFPFETLKMQWQIYQQGNVPKFSGLLKPTIMAAWLPFMSRQIISANSRMLYEQKITDAVKSLPNPEEGNRYWKWLQKRLTIFLVGGMTGGIGYPFDLLYFKMCTEKQPIQNLISSLTLKQVMCGIRCNIILYGTTATLITAIFTALHQLGGICSPHPN